MHTGLTWEELRVDTTFHGRGAEPSPVVRELWAACRDVPGWFTVDDCGHFELALNLQSALGIRGDLLEIGTYHGRSACVLARFVGAGEQLVLCDLFQTSAGEYSDPPTPEQLLANVRRANPRLAHQAVVTHAGPSETLNLGARRVRFAHLDGDHSERGTTADLERVAAHLVGGGILVADDYHNPRYPDVTVAVDRFLARRTDLTVIADLNRHGAMGRKLYLMLRP